MGVVVRRGGVLPALACTLALLCMHAHAARLAHTRHQLPYCKTMLAGVDDHHMGMLRDQAQTYAQHHRKYTHWTQIRDKVIQPMEDPIKQKAYATTLNITEIEALRKAEETSKEAIKSRMLEMVGNLKRNGHLANDVTAHQVQQCVYARLNTHLFERRPKVSLLLQYFKRPKNVQPFIQRVTKCAAEFPIELVVNVDHPQDHEAWAWASYNTSGLVVPVFSNNVHEVRAYNRLTGIARGEYIVLLADDDLPPEDCSWIGNVVRIFDKWPNVGVVGIRNYVACFNLQYGEFDGSNRGDWFKDPLLDLPLQFVEKVDMAPLAIRKAAYRDVGGMDETMTEPGECGIISDWEICFRMWVAGWHVVATKQVHFEHDGQEGGTHKPETAERCWGKQQRIAEEVVHTHVDKTMETIICDQARELTLQNLQMVDPKKCPYRQGCSLLPA